SREVVREKAAGVQVLHAPARALNGSRDYYARLWQDAGKLTRFPTLIVWGLKDSAVTPHQLAKWSALLPQATVVELRDAGHWPHEEKPEAVIQALKRFLAT